MNTNFIVSIATASIVFFGSHFHKDAWALEIEVDSSLVEEDEKTPRSTKYGYYPDPFDFTLKEEIDSKDIPKFQKKYQEFRDKLEQYENEKEKQNLDELDSPQDHIERFLQSSGLQDFYATYRQGGILGSFAGELYRDIVTPVLRCEKLGNRWALDPGQWKQVESYVRVFSNSILQNGYIRVRSHKTFTCEKKSTNEKKVFSIKRRWVLSILGGLYHVEKPNEPTFKYEISALGKRIKLMGYYEVIAPKASNKNPKLVLPSNKIMGHYYIPSNKTCLHIRFKQRPPNGKLIGPSKPNSLEFCASGCKPGDVDATK